MHRVPLAPQSRARRRCMFHAEPARQNTTFPQVMNVLPNALNECSRK